MGEGWEDDRRETVHGFIRQDIICFKGAVAVVVDVVVMFQVT